ncbi:alpha/beta fold hydrolase [Roseococcus pinisoli]|uniref:Alpha/beta hydrolase n=1 Tax=Roseococcus pinisoli TaxID=2835040 RepID=A0ABS5Q725_9PROT|nr:alpha/beta hydrolase [Roseococcus pinisoli]MBS7809427.1 alpha/beta hydrolase [Roseococcus pinisoli]
METPRIGALRGTFDFGAVTLRWTEWGPVSGRPVVCVHGLTRNGRDFDALAQALAAQGRRVICPDVPGRGISDWLPDGALYAVPTYAAALVPLLTQLGEYDWVGTSMGGLIGMGLCAIPGVGLQRMVLNDIGPFVPVASLERIRDYLDAFPEFGSLAELEAQLRRVHAPFGPLSDAEWAHLARHSARVTAAGRFVLHYDPAIAAPMANPLSDVDLWQLWEHVARRPVLVLRGESSDLLLAETAARMGQSPGVTVETIAGCGHAPALMDPAQIGLILRFLEG